MNGELFPVKQAYGEYLRGWYDGLYPTTPGMAEFVARGFGRCVMWAPGRMIDAAEEMLGSYRKNDNDGASNANALLPVVLVAMAKDIMPTGGDFGGRQVGRQMVRLTDEADASVYGYRQAMGDVRTQIVIAAAEEATAKALATQLALFVGEIPNRRFRADFTFGEYTLDMPVMLETPDILWQSIGTDQKNLTMLAADITLKVVIPYLDAPKYGEPNDGSGRNPPGYPVVAEVVSADLVTLRDASTTEAGIEFGPQGSFDEPEAP